MRHVSVIFFKRFKALNEPLNILIMPPSSPLVKHFLANSSTEIKFSPICGMYLASFNVCTKLISNLTITLPTPVMLYETPSHAMTCPWLDSRKWSNQCLLDVTWKDESKLRIHASIWEFIEWLISPSSKVKSMQTWPSSFWCHYICFTLIFSSLFSVFVFFL